MPTEMAILKMARKSFFKGGNPKAFLSRKEKWQGRKR